MKAKMLLLVCCTFLALLFLSARSEAQQLPQGGVLYWPANPPADQVEWYAVQTDNNGTWNQVHGTSTCQTFNEFSAATTITTGFNPPAPLICYWIFELPQLQLGAVQVGDTVCARVQAVKGSERSAPSQEACATVVATVTATGPSGLTRPLQPVLVIQP